MLGALTSSSGPLRAAEELLTQTYALSLANPGVMEQQDGLLESSERAVYRMRWSVAVGGSTREQ